MFAKKEVGSLNLYYVLFTKIRRFSTPSVGVYLLWVYSWVYLAYPPPNGTWDQSIPPLKGPGIPGIPTPSPRQNDRHPRKHYLTPTSLVGGNNKDEYVVFFSPGEIWVGVHHVHSLVFSTLLLAQRKGDIELITSSKRNHIWWPMTHPLNQMQLCHGKYNINQIPRIFSDPENIVPNGHRK